jgi:hypothetical protein
MQATAVTVDGQYPITTMGFKLGPKKIYVPFPIIYIMLNGAMMYTRKKHGF